MTGKDRYDLINWLKLNHTEEELRIPAAWAGGPISWAFEVAKYDMYNEKLPKEYYSLVQEYFNDDSPKDKRKSTNKEYTDTRRYIDVPIPGSDGMGNPVEYERFYRDVPEMGG